MVDELDVKRINREKESKLCDTIFNSAYNDAKAGGFSNSEAFEAGQYSVWYHTGREGYEG